MIPQSFNAYSISLRGHGKSFSSMLSQSVQIKNFIQKTYCEFCEVHLCQECECSKLMRAYDEAANIIKEEFK